MARIPRLPNPGCVLKVGDGRGFVIEYGFRIPPLPKETRVRLRKLQLQLRTFREHRLVITAAHCLPHLPPAHLAAHYYERTYNLLANLHGTIKNVCTECQFTDPVADIAILDSPDAEEMEKEADAYDVLTGDFPALRIGRARHGSGWVLSLENQWIPTPLHVSTNRYGAAALFIGPTKPGMSGSPILNDAGQAIGVVTLGQRTVITTGEHKDSRMHGPQPILTCNLPGWLTQASQSLPRKRKSL